MKLGFITIIVTDLEKSAEFFRELAGLTELRRIHPPVGPIVFLANSEGETMIELIQPEIPMPTYQGQGLGISFAAEGDLTVLRDKAIAMGYEAEPIENHPPAPVNFKVHGPDGLLIEFAQV